MQENYRQSLLIREENSEKPLHITPVIDLNLDCKNTPSDWIGNF